MRHDGQCVAAHRGRESGDHMINTCMIYHITHLSFTQGGGSVEKEEEEDKISFSKIDWKIGRLGSRAPHM